MLRAWAALPWWLRWGLTALAYVGLGLVFAVASILVGSQAGHGG